MRRRRTYHHGSLRRALLDATLSLTQELGPAGVTLRQAAERAGVSQAAPYRHFAGKDAMIAAAAEEGFALLRGALLEAARGAAADPAERLAAWVACYARFAVGHPAHFRLMFGQASAPKSVTAALQAAARDTFQLLLGTVTELARSRGLEASDGRRLALDVWSVAHGMATLAIDGQTSFLGVPPQRIGAAARAAGSALVAGW